MFNTSPLPGRSTTSMIDETILIRLEIIYVVLEVIVTVKESQGDLYKKIHEKIIAPTFLMLFKKADFWNEFKTLETMNNKTR